MAAITFSSFCPVKYVLKNSVRVMPSRRCSRSVTAVIEFAIGTLALSRYNSAFVRPRTTRYRCPASSKSSSTFTVARAVARLNRSDSRVPRAALFPYNAHAIASRIVVFPDPFGPMIPVSPVSNVIRLSSVLPEVLEVQAVEPHSSAPTTSGVANDAALIASASAR